MADISTGSQRGIVPFVDETTGRLPDQYLPQGVIDLQGDLEQAVSDAGASATAAQQSASQAQSNATAAGSAAQAAAASAESAQTATESAASSKDAAAQSASEASESAQAAEASKTNAASSASAAETSKTNAAASASAAKASETNAAASATAAQQAVDGFGLEAGTTTTGDPGTDAAVDIQKTGTKYTANFTIPRGDVGPAGVNENVPLGTASGVVAQAKDAYPALPRKVRVHGRTVENLWPEINGSKNGITVSTESGVINVTGTASSRFSTQSVVGCLSPGDRITIAVNKADSNVSFELYAYNSGSWVSSIASVKGKASASGEIPADGFDEIRAYIIVEQGVTVDWSGMVMLVEGDAVPDVFVPSGVHTVEPKQLVIYGESEQEDKSEISLPSDISLVDGDTLAIDRDGTTRIVHAEGEPTVLENVILPELPAPTFNVYTTGGYVPPTVDVDYERDVNLVLQALEAKIAALQVADKTN